MFKTLYFFIDRHKPWPLNLLIFTGDNIKQWSRYKDSFARNINRCSVTVWRRAVNHPSARRKGSDLSRQCWSKCGAGTIIQLWILMDWISWTKTQVSAHIWCRWRGCVYQFGHWGKSLRIRPYWYDPLLCHDTPGFWNQLTLRAVHGPDRTESSCTSFAEHAALKTCFAAYLYLWHFWGWGWWPSKNRRSPVP